jgi:hypothetical protein
MTFIMIENDPFKDLIQITHARLADMILPETSYTHGSWRKNESHKVKLKRRLHEDVIKEDIIKAVTCL